MLYKKPDDYIPVSVNFIAAENIVANLKTIKNISRRCEVRSLVESYTPVNPKESCVKMKIIRTDEIPVHLKRRRLAPVERAMVMQQISEWIEGGIVRESTSNYASPIFLAKRKDGSTSLCVGYRHLNRQIIRDRYPLPNIEKSFANVYSAKVFTALNLRNRFFHVDI